MNEQSKSLAYFDKYKKVVSNSYRTQCVYSFPNGYGASVIDLSQYQFGLGLELAVLLEGELCYDTPITNDVLGNLTQETLTEALNRIYNLRG